MATRDETYEVLFEAIEAAAKKSDTANSTNAENFASAARQLAEAVAWLSSPAQPH